MSKLKVISSSKCFDGLQNVYSHFSDELKCDMKFSVYMPPQSNEKKSPVIFWLSGLTCTEQNFIIKSGFQQYASKYGTIVVGPDTSPRGCNIDGEEDLYHFGTGAGFYVDATEPLWKNHYRMYSYVTKELYNLVNAEFPSNGKVSIMGHSMGGHGALICALKNPGKYSSLSAFAPICNPSKSPWGEYAFSRYLGKDKSTWAEYDASMLVSKYSGPDLKVLIDQGDSDEFLKEELLPDNFIKACERTKVSPDLRMRKGYDHSFFFISTFLEDHFKHHAQYHE